MLKTKMINGTWKRDVSCPFSLQLHKNKERINCTFQNISRMFTCSLVLSGSRHRDKREKAILNITSSPHLLNSNHLQNHFDYFCSFLVLISNCIGQDHWQTMEFSFPDLSLPVPTSNFLWHRGIFSLIRVNIYGDGNNFFFFFLFKFQLGVRNYRSSSEMWLLVNI